MFSSFLSLTDISDRAAQQASAMLGGSDSASFVANRSMLGISSVAASTPAEQAVGEGDDIWQEFDQDSGSNYDRKGTFSSGPQTLPAFIHCVFLLWFAASGRGRRSSSSAQVDDSTPTGDAAGILFHSILSSDSVKHQFHHLFSSYRC
jgi:hypothetical protein